MNHDTAVGGLHFNAGPRPQGTQHEPTLLFRGTNTRSKREIGCGVPGFRSGFEVALAPYIGA